MEYRKQVKIKSPDSGRTAHEQQVCKQGDKKKKN